MVNIIKKDSTPAKYVVGKYLAQKNGNIYKITKENDDGSFDLEEYYNGKWHRHGSVTPGKEGYTYEYIPIDSPEDLENAYNEVMKHPEKYQIDEDTEVDASSTALTIAKPLSYVTSLQDALKEKERTVRVANIYMERQKNKLDSIVRAFAKQISKLQKIIDAIEMYLGTNAKVVIIQEGVPVDGPIYIRQGILYMDEEYGDPRHNPNTHQKGLDFQNVEDFDTWLIKNIDKVLPEKKGILAMKPSRQDRSYSDNAFINASIKANNSMTYLIIRNGENICRLWTSIAFGDRLYPTQADMANLLKMLDDDSVWQSDKERALDGEYIYKRNVLIMQGLVDRTDMFKPLKDGASLFKPETYDGAFELIRDDENIIDDGRPSWKEWREETNSKIGVGSRILFIDPNELFHSYHSAKDFKGRYVIYSNNDNYPDLPSTGLYQIIGFKENKGSYSKIDNLYYFKYAPGDEVWWGSGWDYDPHPRKNRVSFGIRADDRFVFNYDQISLDDVEYYLTTRKDKKDFIEYTITLWNIRDMLLAEQEKEKHFVSLVADRLNVDEKIVWKAVDWWKFKNKWKRRIDSDDAKALRMIEKHINSHKQV